MMKENGWERSRDPVGIWEHRGKVALAGRGHSATDRRWDGESLDQTLGVHVMDAARLAMEDAGISPDEVDGIVTSAGGQPGGAPLSDVWAPRPFFDPPYDSEDGLTHVTAGWLAQQMGLKNVKYTYSHGGPIWNLIGLAAQIVGDGRATVVLVPYPNGNLPGRYHQNPSNVARGPAQWSDTWGWGLSGQGFTFDQYCRKYGSNHDRMAPFVVQEHQNGLLWPHSYYAQHEPEPFTTEDYLNGRMIAKGLSIFDCDRPVMAGACYVVTTAERARNMKQKPVYVLDHTESGFSPRSLVQTLDDTEEWTDVQAKRAYAGSGLTAKDIDLFAPYDGFAVFTQYFLEAFGWRGVKRGEAHDFYAGDISLGGPNPINSGGGNMGTGRMRTVFVTDLMEQLQGRAGARQVKIKAEVAVTIGVLPVTAGVLALSSNPG
ncbi:MAG: thiolase family protein [Chloroflexi bacterium]|nr:thiolase family protein [Chloroflexota bacterium]